MYQYIEQERINNVRDEITNNYKQKSSMALRMSDIDDYKSVFGDSVEKRSEFARDKDRILFSKAFRRLQHKAQVYSHEKGDHYRTRLTHTLEVMQIARGIARNLSLNEDLTESIALGHDIGHTPFGHEGEIVLDDFLRGNGTLNKKFKFDIDYNGFKHNFNSLRILDVLEVKYPNEKGLNLTWQVMEGILKHTKIEKQGKKYDLFRFMQNEHILPEIEMKDDDGHFSVTLEGQIVAIADEIAQRQHDLDDGLRDIEQNLSFEEILDTIIDFIADIQEIIKEESEEIIFMEVEKELLTALDELLSELKSTEDCESYKIIALINCIVSFFIHDVSLKTILNIEEIMNNGERPITTSNDKKYVTQRIVNFSNIGKKLNDNIERFVENRIVNSFNVNRFDGKANYVIRRLFKAYYNNPLQMPKDDLNFLSDKILANSTKFTEIKFHNGTIDESLNISNINFEDSPRKDIDNLIKVLKLDYQFIQDNLENSPLEVALSVDKGAPANIENLMPEINKYLLFEEFNYHNPRIIQNEEKFKFLKCLLENHYAFLSTICDYISCMTDNFANSEYKKLYMG